MTETKKGNEAIIQEDPRRYRVGFIGAGNMAKAIVSGMLAKKAVRPEDILVSRRSREALEQLQKEWGIAVTTDNMEVARTADIVFLAVKPQVLSEVIAQIRTEIKEHQLFISIAAGKTLTWLEKEFETKVKLVRSMPNTPAMVGEGCTGFCVNPMVTQEEKNLVRHFFECCGTAYEVPEQLMDVVGAAAGSAPAFVFVFAEAMADAAVAAGMPRRMAYDMAAQTLLGSGKLLQETGKHPGELKDMVCSPAGTTICGVRVLEEQGMRGAVMDALDSCIQKSRNL